MNNANLDPAANQGIPMEDAPRKRVAIMASVDTHSTLIEIARRISSMPAEHERRAEEIKERVRAEMQALDKEFQELNNTAWDQLQDELGLDKDLNYTLCTDHLDQHGVVFVTEQEPEESDLPSGLDIGNIIAKALGGRMIAGSENGGVIEVKR